MNTKEEFIIKEFLIDGEFISAIPYGSGHINDTKLVTVRVGEDEKKYVLQRINTKIFTKPYELMQNIENVTEFLRGKIICFLALKNA